jgi:hypothetical protein
MTTPFFATTGLKTDPATTLAENNANETVFGYITSTMAAPFRGFWFGNDGLKEAANLAVDTPTMNFTGQGLPRDAVDVGSSLRVGETWRPRMRQDLNPRPFATTGWMGYGAGTTDADTSSDLQFSMHYRQPKSISTISGRQNFYYDAPLIPEKIEDIKNSKLWIEEDAEGGWVRGGIDTRVVRIKEHKPSHNPFGVVENALKGIL